MQESLQTALIQTPLIQTAVMSKDLNGVVRRHISMMRLWQERRDVCRGAAIAWDKNFCEMTKGKEPLRHCGIGKTLVVIEACTSSGFEDKILIKSQVRNSHFGSAAEVVSIVVLPACDAIPFCTSHAIMVQARSALGMMRRCVSSSCSRRCNIPKRLCADLQTSDVLA